MSLTKGILVAFTALIVVAELKWTGYPNMLCGLHVGLALCIGFCGLRLHTNLRRHYGLMAAAGALLSISYFVQMTRLHDFAPHGYLWMAAMCVALITLIKYLQNL